MPPEIYNTALDIIELAPTIFRSILPDNVSLNEKILEKFNIFENHKATRKTHFFEGRYENIYIQKKLIVEIEQILVHCERCVKKITRKNIKQSGLWFNKMLPGQSTLAHSHDDSDELYSAVYYVCVPINSGNLIIKQKTKELIITPIAGQLILFPPNLVHRVSNNQSNQIRLSMAINIGSDQTLHSEIK